MLRIAALNEEFSEESSGIDEPSVPTKEVDEAESLNLYKEALGLRQKNEIEAALKLFHETLALPCIENASLEEKDRKDHSRITAFSSCLQIKYACLKNIGAICTTKGHQEEALEAYLEAVEVDPLDVTVWYNIGKISMCLKNFQLARHAFLQGLECSPNHWPSLDGLIDVLFGLGDDIVCLHYINAALERDPFYTRGLIMRDYIFQSCPSLKDDAKIISNGKWTQLFQTCSYSEEEKRECLEEAQKLREEVGGRYSEVALQSFPLTKNTDSLTWVALGENLLKTYNDIMGNGSSLKMCCLVELRQLKEDEEIMMDLPSPKHLVDEMSEIENMEVEPSTAKDAHQVDELQEAKEQPKSISTSDENGKTEVEVNTDISAKTEAPVKTDSRKRKRSLENGTSVTDKEIQRRSTRSRAYAQQVEEDIYSLRAELRSFLPTSLLLDEHFEAIKDSKTEVKVDNLEADQLDDIPTVVEEEGVSLFLEEAQQSKTRITDLLAKYCMCVAKLDKFRWTKELSNTFKDVYHIVRNLFPVYDVFQRDDEICDLRGLEILIHAEILVSCQKADPSLTIPSWFVEDLTYLFQCADPIDTVLTHSNEFRARVFWLHCNWYYQTGRVEVASSYLHMVKNCIRQHVVKDSSDTRFCIPIHATSKPTVVKVCHVTEMDEVLDRTMQLEDVSKLHQEKKFKQLVNILKATFTNSYSKKQNYKYRVPVDRPTQIMMMLEGLSALEDYDEYLVWSEQSLNESTSQYLAAFTNKTAEECSGSDQPPESLTSTSWSKVIEHVSSEVEDMLHAKRTSLCILNRPSLVRFAENLVLICSHQLEASDTNSKMPLNSPIFWVLLHRVIEFEESRLASVKKTEMSSQDSAEDATEEDQALPCSVLFLISAHDLLGKRSWCMLQDGIFVLHLLEVLMRKRRTVHYLEDLEELGRAIEQASFCALGYPTSKKSKGRSLTDHAVTSVPMTWNRVLLLAEFFLPSREELPEFDTVKPTSNAEQEVLLQKVSSLIPSELDPRNRLEDIQGFIQGLMPDIPEYLHHSCVPPEVENVYYLLGDYYFKNKEWSKAIENYILDLALVPDRFDSWAAVALAIGSRLETKLNSCERLKNLVGFLDRSETALRCFRRALRLRPLQTTLWIEQGSTAYMLHSFCSQLLRNETDSLSIEMFERLEKEKERMLDIAHDCFVASDKSSLLAIEKDGDDQDERWLHHYMLGKIAEKRSKPFGELIEHYQRAAQLLEEASATYPRKISYNTPPLFSVEALEIYYRIHSNCLKTLMNLEGKPVDAPVYLAISKQLERAASGAFANGGRKVSADQKDDNQEKETKKRKASKHEEEKSSKKPNTDVTEPIIPEVKLEGRAATIHDVSIILNEIIEKVIQISKPSETKTEEIPIKSAENSSLSMEIEKVQSVKVGDNDAFQSSDEMPIHSQTSTSSSSDSSSSDSDEESSSSSESEDEKENESKDDQKRKQEPEVAPVPPEVVPDLQSMVDMCLAAIKECVARFPHFYKGLYRLAHYYYHSKVNHNIDACRELLLGRPISASMVQLQQQQGVVQVRYLPTGVAGLFTEWRSNNFFHSIWRIPINEIDRPGCFASHMGRSAALLLDVLRDTKDHRLLMELALALQPEPEPDKKYLFDSEREQHASLALTLMVKVLRSRLQEVKDATNVNAVGSDDMHISPQQGSPSSSKKLSLLMDTFRAYDRIERNLPGQEAVFAALLIDSYKVYRGPKDHNESDTVLMEQALTFCRNKQAQSRARVGGVRGGLASSLGITASRGKRPYTATRRGRTATVPRTAIRDHPIVNPTLTQAPASGAANNQSSANVMQEALKLLQSAGGSVNNLPQHLKNIPGISNLLAMFSNPADKPQPDASGAAPSTSPARPKKEAPSPKTVVQQVPPVASTASQSQMASTNSLLQTLAAMGGTTPLQPSLTSLGMMDPTMLAMLSNPYLNPLGMFGTPMSGSLGGADASSMSKMQQEYQQQLSQWMQTTLAQSYVLSNLNQPLFGTQRSRGRGVRKTPSNKAHVKSNTAPRNTFNLPSNVSSESSIAAPSTSSNRTSTPDAPSRAKPMDSAKRADLVDARSSKTNEAVRPGATAAKFPNDFKLPPPLFDSSMMKSNSHQDSGGKPKAVAPSTQSKKKSLPQASTSSEPGKPHKRAMTTPTIDVSKLIAGFSPGFDFSRLGKMDPKAIDNAIRGKLSKSGAELHQTPTSSKPSSSKQAVKESTAPPPFPLNLGRDITVTATSTKSASQLSFPSAPAGTSRAKQSNMPSSHGNSGFPVIPPTSQLFSHSGGSGNTGKQTDPQNIAFSVLQNLPSSMSLLVKSNTSQPKQNVVKGQAGPIDLVVNKNPQPHHMAPLPKLTPAPNLQAGKKGKQHTVSSHVPPLSFKTSSSSPVPPFLPNVPMPNLNPASHSAAPRNLSTQKSQPKQKSSGKNGSDDPDVVILD